VPPEKVNLPLVIIAISENFWNYPFLPGCLFTAFMTNTRIKVADKASRKPSVVCISLLPVFFDKISPNAARQAIKTTMGSKNAITTFEAIEDPLAPPNRR